MPHPGPIIGHHYPPIHHGHGHSHGHWHDCCCGNSIWCCGGGYGGSFFGGISGGFWGGFQTAFGQCLGGWLGGLASGLMSGMMGGMMGMSMYGGGWFGGMMGMPFMGGGSFSGFNLYPENYDWMGMNMGYGYGYGYGNAYSGNVALKPASKKVEPLTPSGGEVITYEDPIAKLIATPTKENVLAAYNELVKTKTITIGEYVEKAKKIEQVLYENPVINVTKPDGVVDIQDQWLNDAFKSLTVEKYEQLTRAGVEPIDIGNGNYALSLPSTINKASLELLQDANINVAMAYNSGQDVTDKWIAGKISNVTENEGRISYEIDCSDCPGAMHQFKYSVTQCQSGDECWVIKYLSGHKGNTTLYTINDGKTYKFDQDNRRLNINDKPLISATKHDDYTEIVTDAS